MKKIITIFICILIYTPLEYLAVEFAKHLFIEGYSTAESFMEVWYFCIIYSSIAVLLILLFSLLIKRNAVNNSIVKIGLKIGGLLFVIWFLFSGFVSFGSVNFPMIISFAVINFTIGFTFPILYSFFNKKPLFSKDFY